MRVENTDRVYLLREGHVIGFFCGSVLTTVWPPLAGAWLLLAVALWVKSWRSAADTGPAPSEGSTEAQREHR